MNRQRKYSDCYTWSDLDVHHCLQLNSTAYLEQYPYLVERGVKNGDEFQIIRQGGQDANRNTTWKAVRHLKLQLEFMIPRNEINNLLHCYENKSLFPKRTYQ